MKALSSSTVPQRSQKIIHKAYKSHTIRGQKPAGLSNMVQISTTDFQL